MRKLPTKSIRLWLARDEIGHLFLHLEKPTKWKGGGMWISSTNKLLADSLDKPFPKGIFPSVKWEDKEPTRVSLRLV